jgi:hypothetical protein
MLDMLLCAAIVLLGLVVNWIAVNRTKTWVNPASMITAGYFIPLAFALFRLSDLQAPRWTDDTYAVLLESVVMWLLLPGGLSLLARPGALATPGERRSPWILRFARAFAIAHIAAVLIQNKLVGGHAFLFVDPEAAYEHHTDTLGGLQILGRANFIAVALLHLAIFGWRNRKDVVLLGIVLLMPLTKLARIDVLMSGVTLVAMNAIYPLVRVTARRVVTLAALGMLGVYGLVEIGNQRVSRFGRYSFSYADAIGFNTYAGPGDTFAVLYGYFPLSFENFDRFVRRNTDFRTGGALSFSPIFNTATFATKLTAGKYPSETIIVDRRDPVGPMATVGTALTAYYLDFGAEGAWIPMAVFMLVWWALFTRRRRSDAHALAFCAYSSAMFLASFQAVASTAVVYQDILLGVVPLALLRLSTRGDEPRMATPSSAIT